MHMRAHACTCTSHRFAGVRVGSVVASATTVRQARIATLNTKGLRHDQGHRTERRRDHGREQDPAGRGGLCHVLHITQT